MQVAPSKEYERAKERRRAHERERAALLSLILSHCRCKACGESDERVLVFHHRDPARKLFDVAVGFRQYGMEKILAEIDKCDILCANDHRRAHCPL